MANFLLAEIDTTTILTYVVLGVLIVAIVVMFIFSGKRRKKQEEEAKKLIDAVKPGNKVKTIGGICGIVVEVDSEENTFVLETGTEQSGKCFIKFDRQAIYQTDAVVEKDEVKPEEKAEEKVEETTVEKASEPEALHVEEPAKAEEPENVEEPANEKPSKKKSNKQ